MKQLGLKRLVTKPLGVLTSRRIADGPPSWLAVSITTASSKRLAL
jgi:hypothetical protein